MLESILTPADLRKLDRQDLPQICDELRKFLLGSVSSVGGHFSSNLGTVELTVALHYVFDTPSDRLVWDVGHQAYPHKILTGRRDEMRSIRRWGGLAGFPKRDESHFDTFGVGHSSTSISAALGMALASRHRGEKREAVAVIGDGALTAGMAYEALNHAGDLDANLLVVLNDNDMSISPNVGAIRRYLTRLLAGEFYTSVREQGKRLLSVSETLKRFAKRTEEQMKGFVLPGTLFEQMGFHYFGPLDGHDVLELVSVLEKLKKIDGPRLLHVVTQKGKGYEAAEQDPVKYHGVSPFNLESGIYSQKSVQDKPLTYTQVFGQWLCDAAEQDSSLIGITPAMREGSGLVAFSEQYPDRYYDVAIAEQHAVTLAAGLACENMRPVVAIYSTFLQRAYDQLIHDVAIQNLAVTFALDRAGLVGADGPTHSGNYDISYLRCIPNMAVMVPCDENECRLLLQTAHNMDGPAAVRYPRGAGPGKPVSGELDTVPVGEAEQRRQGKSGISVLLFGALLESAEMLSNEFDANLFNMRFVKPLDTNCLDILMASEQVIVTLEDNAVMGGAGSATNDYLLARGFAGRMINFGIPDRFVEHGSREEQLADVGLTGSQLIDRLAVMLHDDAGSVQVISK